MRKGRGKAEDMGSSGLGVSLKVFVVFASFRQEKGHPKRQP